MPASPRFDSTTAPGWVQLAGEPEWTGAHFTTSPLDDGAELSIERPGTSRSTTIDLRDVTALDELLGAPPGFQHVEIALSSEPFAQAVWPDSFTASVLDGLATTIDLTDDSHDRTSARSLASSGVIAALALAGCGAVVVGALGLRDHGTVPVDTEVLTQTTIRGPVEATTPSSTVSSSTVSPNTVSTTVPSAAAPSTSTTSQPAPG